MTGWDPVPQLAGTKRVRSPEAQTTRTRSGREIVRHDHKRLNHGRVAQALTNPQSWDEAMTSV